MGFTTWSCLIALQSRHAPLAHKKYGLPKGRVPHMDPKQYQSFRRSESPPTNPSAPNTPMTSTEHLGVAVKIDTAGSVSDDEIEHLNLQEVKNVSGNKDLSHSNWASPSVNCEHMFSSTPTPTNRYAVHTNLGPEQTKSSSRWLDPKAKKFVRSSSQSHGSPAKNEVLLHRSSDSRISMAEVESIIKIEGQSPKTSGMPELEKLNSRKNTADVVSPINDLPHMRPVQPNTSVEASRSAYANLTDTSYKPTYEEMCDRTSRWYLPPHARPNRPVANASTKDENKNEKIAKGQTCLSDTPGGLTMGQAQTPIRSDEMAMAESESTVDQDRLRIFQQKQRTINVAQDIGIKTNSRNQYASSTSSSNISSDSGIVITTLPVNGGEQEHSGISAASKHTEKSPMEHRQHKDDHVKNNVGVQLSIPSMTTTKLPSQQEWSLKPASSTDTQSPSTSSTIDRTNHKENEEDKSTPVCSQPAKIATRSNYEASYVLPHMRTKENLAYSIARSNKNTDKDTQSSRSLSTSSEGASAQGALLEPKQSPVQHHETSSSAVLDTKTDHENILAVQKDTPAAVTNFTATQNGYLAPEDEFMKAAASSKRPPTTYGTSSINMSKDTKHASGYRNASTNPLWTTITDVASFASAVKSKEKSQPKAAKYYYRQNDEETADNDTKNSKSTVEIDNSVAQKTRVGSSLANAIDESGFKVDMTKNDAGQFESELSAKRQSIREEGAEVSGKSDNTIRETSTSPQDANVTSKQVALKLQSSPTGEHKPVLCSTNVESYAQGNPTFQEVVLKEINEHEKLKQLENGHSLTKEKLAAVGGLTRVAHSISASSVVAFTTSGVEDHETNKEVPMEVSLAIQDHHELADWNGEMMPPPCDWEYDRPMFDASTHLTDTVMKWLPPCPKDQVDMKSKLFSSEQTSGGVVVAIAHTIDESGFLSPPADFKPKQGDYRYYDLVPTSELICHR